jgi:hypothetical protein
MKPAEPASVYRQRHDLPESFGVAGLFPKDFSGLASTAASGAALKALRAEVLAQVPTAVPDEKALAAAIAALGTAFRAALQAANAAIGLTDEQLEFAVAGFVDVLEAWHMALVRSRRAGPLPQFAQVYQAFVAGSHMPASAWLAYPHAGQVWQVRATADIYGRTGLEVRRPDAPPEAVADPVYRCPAEPFMAGLLQAVAERLLCAFAHPSPTHPSPEEA